MPPRRQRSEQAGRRRLGDEPDANHTRIPDLAWPEGSATTQGEMMSGYPPHPDSLDGLSPTDLPQVEMLQAEGGS